MRELGRQDEESGRMQARRWLRVALAALLGLAIIGFYAGGLHHYFSWDFVRGHLDAWQAFVRDHLLLSLGVFFLIYVAVTALSLPVATVLGLLAGALFGRWLGTAVVSLASTLGATLAFLSSRYVLRDWVQHQFAARLEPINQGIEKEGAYYLFLLRLVPVVPFFLINLALGLTPMRVATFAAVSWLGMLLGTFLYVNAGTELAALDSPAGLLSWQVLLSLALLGIVPLGIRKVVRCRQVADEKEETGRQAVARPTTGKIESPAHDSGPGPNEVGGEQGERSP
jgi:uncharacterized membrane protein YdjX (TVP38/TMEM64 family)